MAQVQGITAQLRERVDGEAAARATYAASATVNSKLLRGFLRSSAGSAAETSDGTVHLWAAADGRYRIDGRDKIKRDGPQLVANDGLYLWQFIGNRVYRWDPEPLPKPIKTMLHPELILDRSRVKAGDTVSVGGREGSSYHVKFPHLDSVTSPLAWKSVLADGAEIVKDNSLGIALQITWLFGNESLLCLELGSVTESVDPEVFQVVPPDDARLITTKNLLAVAPPGKTVAAVMRLATDLSSRAVKNWRATH